MKKLLLALVVLVAVVTFWVGVARQFGRPHVIDGWSAFTGEELRVEIKIAREPWPNIWRPSRTYKMVAVADDIKPYIMEALYVEGEVLPVFICRTESADFGDTGVKALCASPRGQEDAALLAVLRDDFDTRHIVTRELMRLRDESLQDLPRQSPKPRPTIIY